MRKLVMFDMDGVLFDTMPLHAKAWIRTMQELGKELPATLFYRNEGRNGESMIREIFGAEMDYKAVYRRKCEIFDEMPEARVMPGAVSAVKAVRDAGREAIVVTGSGQIHTIARLEKEFKGLFNIDWMVTGNDVRRGKPDPEPYLMGLGKAGVSADEAFVIENAPLGIRSGRAAGCRVLAVNTGPLDDSLLLDEGAYRLFHSMDELAEALPGLLSEQE